MWSCRCRRALPCLEFCIRSRRSTFPVREVAVSLRYKLESAANLKTSSLKLARAEHHHQTGTLAYDRVRFFCAAQLVIVLVVCVHGLLALQIDLKVAIRAVGAVKRIHKLNETGDWCGFFLLIQSNVKTSTAMSTTISKASKSCFEMIFRASSTRLHIARAKCKRISSEQTSSIIKQIMKLLVQQHYEERNFLRSVCSDKKLKSFRLNISCEHFKKLDMS